MTHVRLCMYPDGGVARLRAHGEAVPDPRFLGTGEIDLAALANGGVVTGCSNMFYSSPSNLISPGQARVMGEGWETARRRDDDNDWVEFRWPALVGCGWPSWTRPTSSEMRPAGLRCADATSLRGSDDDWVELLPRTRLQPDTRHLFRIFDAPETTGPARRLSRRGHGPVRLHGELSQRGREELVLRWLNSLPDAHARQVLVDGGLDRDQADELVAARPMNTFADLPARVRSFLGG